jgi:hypothetical protein
MTVHLTGNTLTFEQLFDVSLHGAEAALASEARALVRKVSAQLDSGRPLAMEIEALATRIGEGDFAELLR